VFDLSIDEDLVGKLKKSNTIRKMLAPMHVRRQNFGCTCLKNNPENKKSSLEFLKVVVAGGWTGRH